MVLTEFDLDLPEKNKNSRHYFRNEVRCVAAQYFSHFPAKFKTDNFWKVLVECASHDDAPKLYMNVMTVKVNFNFDHYLNLTNVEKKKVVLDALHRGLTRVSEEKGWEQLTLEKCRSKVVESDYNYIWTFKKPKKNKSRNLLATIVCHHDIDKFTAVLTVTELDGQLVYQTNLVEELPNEFVFAYRLGDFKWTSNDEIEFYNKANMLSARVNVSDKSVVFETIDP